jgi:hypothetical protein
MVHPDGWICELMSREGENLIKSFAARFVYLWTAQPDDFRDTVWLSNEEPPVLEKPINIRGAFQTRVVWKCHWSYQRARQDSQSWKPSGYFAGIRIIWIYAIGKM